MYTAMTARPFDSPVILPAYDKTAMGFAGLGDKFSEWGPLDMVMGARSFGLGCTECEGTCGGGLGLFESGLDWSKWTWKEIASLGMIGFIVYSVQTTSVRTARAVGSRASGVRKGLARRRRQRDKEEYESWKSGGSKKGGPGFLAGGFFALIAVTAIAYTWLAISKRTPVEGVPTE